MKGVFGWRSLTNWQLQQDDYYSHVGNSVQSGLLQSLMITKTTGKLIPKTSFELAGKKGQRKILAKDDKTWRLKQCVVSAKNFYPDPIFGRGLYEIEEMWVDYHEVLRQTEGDDPLYSKAAVMELSKGQIRDFEEDNRQFRETAQNTTHTEEQFLK